MHRLDTVMGMEAAIPKPLADILSWDARAFAHLATIGPSGEPQSSPVWFDWEDDQIKVSVYENSQKLRNIRGDRRVSVSIIDPDDPYRYLEIRGVVTSFVRDSEMALLTRLSGKYLGLDHYPWGRDDDVEVVLTIEPEHVVGMGG